MTAAITDGQEYAGRITWLFLDWCFRQLSDNTRAAVPEETRNIGEPELNSFRKETSSGALKNALKIVLIRMG
jgi:hypothetical protein